MTPRRMRKLLERQEGQALVIAVLALLILTLAVLATVNIGQKVNERVRLQNTADAAAYSMAAMEARAFNFYAFSNRTQVSHYVSAMLWQSMLSFAYWAEAMLVDVYGLLKTLDICDGWLMGAVCGVIDQLFPFLKLLRDIRPLYFGVLFFIVLPQFRTKDPDRFVGRLVIPAYRVMNELLAASAEATLKATLEPVQRASFDIIQANDPNISAAAQRLESGKLSTCMLMRAHDRTAMNAAGPTGAAAVFRALDPTARRENSKVARAKRVMAQLANATRFSCDGQKDCSPGWATSRTPRDLILEPNNLGQVQKYIDMLPPDWKFGQTKLLTYGYSQGYARRNGTPLNFIRDWQDRPGRPVGMLAQGDAMGSDDIYQIKIGDSEYGPIKNPLSCPEGADRNRCSGDPNRGKLNGPDPDVPFRKMVETSIWAMSNSEVPGGVHWRLAYPLGSGYYPRGASKKDMPLGWPDENKVEALMGLSLVKGYIVDFWVANTRMIFDGNHPWEGMTAFPHFEPGQFATGCPSPEMPNPNVAATRRALPFTVSEDFNQPSAFVVLHKSAAEQENHGDPTGAGNSLPAMLNEKKTLEFQFAAEMSTLAFDETKAQFLSGVGLNVMTRAQTYYHRPGNWHEQPNFFNPYWRPRLAPIWQAERQFPYAGQVQRALPSPARYLPQKFITH